jgi:hypothetical protein
VYPQVGSRRFALLRVVIFRISAGHAVFCSRVAGPVTVNEDNVPTYLALDQRQPSGRAHRAGSNDSILISLPPEALDVWLCLRR